MTVIIIYTDNLRKESSADPTLDIRYERGKLQWIRSNALHAIALSRCDNNHNNNGARSKFIAVLLSNADRRTETHCETRMRSHRNVTACAPQEHRKRSKSLRSGRKLNRGRYDNAISMIFAALGYRVRNADEIYESRVPWILITQHDLHPAR